MPHRLGAVKGEHHRNQGHYGAEEASADGRHRGGHLQLWCGLARANELAHVLSDAGATKIVVSHLQRTQQTAAPSAGHLGLTSVVVPAAAVNSIAGLVRSGSGSVLVVGHSNTVPDVIDSLAGTSIVDSAVCRRREGVVRIAQV